MRSNQPSSPRAVRSAARRASFDAPTADTALLAYLLGLLLFMIAAGGVVCWLARPTTLPNGGIAAFELEILERERRVPIALSSASSWTDAEKLAADVAHRENQRQGLRLANTESQREQPGSPTSKTAKASPPPKAKRVARAQPRDTTPRWRDAWAFAPQRSGFGHSGGWGSWFR